MTTNIQPRKRSSNAYTRLQSRTAVAFLLPNLLGFLLFVVYPVFRALIISMTNWNGFKKMDYVGFTNYVKLFSDSTFTISLQNTLFYTLVTVPLSIMFGILMALRKDRLGDKLGNAYIIFIMAVPSLAYIYMLAAFGTKTFDLPYKFAMANPKILGYILPTISLALPQIGNLMKWMRRFMIDQMNSDYVKFARSQGLSEREIFSTHVSRNALIPLVHGIPASILGCLTGAIITERVYAVEGVGNLLTTAISKHDNAVIIACTVFYTTLSIVSLILGDLLLAKYDPRISLNADKGGGR